MKEYKIDYPILGDKTELVRSKKSIVELLRYGHCCNKDLEYQLAEFEYSLSNLLGDNGFEDYLTVAKFALLEKFRYVVDIGCASGPQAEVFKGIATYIGVEKHPLLFWKEDVAIPISKVVESKEFSISYIKQAFPWKLEENPIKDLNRVLGISRLCVGYELKQYKPLAENFNDLFLDAPKETIEYITKFYRQVAKINDIHNKHNGWYWFHSSKLLN